MNYTAKYIAQKVSIQHKYPLNDNSFVKFVEFIMGKRGTFILIMFKYIYKNIFGIRIIFILKSSMFPIAEGMETTNSLYLSL